MNAGTYSASCVNMWRWSLQKRWSYRKSSANGRSHGAVLICSVSTRRQS